LLATQGAVLHHLIRLQDRGRRRIGKPVITGFFTVISTLIDEKRRVQPCFGSEYAEYRSRVRSLMLTLSMKVSIVAALLVAAAGFFF
jgi:hypothetical protein